MNQFLKLAIWLGLSMVVIGLVGSQLIPGLLLAHIFLLAAAGGIMMAIASMGLRREFRNPTSIRAVLSEADWQSLMAKVTFPHMTQTWAFGEAKRASNWEPRRLLITHDQGTPVAICQVLYKKIAGIPVVARVNLGPLMLEWHAHKQALVHKAIRRHFRFRCCLLLIAPAMVRGSDATLKKLGFRRRGLFNWESSRLDLTKTDVDLRKGLDSK